MTFNKEALKRWSTWANAGALVVGAAMIYLPDVLPAGAVSYVMLACSTFVAACQAIKQGANSA